jgi:hypothetical protein
MLLKLLSKIITRDQDILSDPIIDDLSFNLGHLSTIKFENSYLYPYLKSLSFALLIEFFKEKEFIVDNISPTNPYINNMFSISGTRFRTFILVWDHIFLI